MGEPGLVTGGGAGYALAVDPGWVDACEVLRLAEAAAALRAAGDAAATARCCATALAMFHGEVLPDGGDGAWLAPHRSRLEEVRMRLTEDHIGARIALGAAGQVIGELETLVAAHPLREGLWRLLITALYQTGRQADALAAYRRIQRLLDDELGLDPGVELQTLEAQILRQDEALTQPIGPSGPAGLGSSLVGRKADVSAVSRLVGEHRLVTVVGPAGVGKTRLASELSAGGVGLVRLESARTAAAIWASVGEALNLDAAAESSVLDRLRGSTVRLVLDNCEHLVAELSEPVDRMLTAGPGVRVLATSQRPLGIDEEAVYHLEPLTVADSIELFIERAAQQRRSFQVDAETRPVVEAVCRSLDGLPLAIELAAARVKALSVQEIARRLEDRFALLSDPTSHRPERQRALGAAIAWSYDLLFPDDQRGLWALACFAGGAPLSAVESVLLAIGCAASRHGRRAEPACRSLLGRGGHRQRWCGALPAARQRPRLLPGPARGVGRPRCRPPGPRRLGSRSGRPGRRRRTRPGAGRAPGGGPYRAGQHRRSPGLDQRARSSVGNAHRQWVRLGLGHPRRWGRGGGPPSRDRCRGPRHGTAAVTAPLDCCWPAGWRRPGGMSSRRPPISNGPWCSAATSRSAWPDSTSRSCAPCSGSRARPWRWPRPARPTSTGWARTGRKGPAGCCRPGLISASAIWPTAKAASEQALKLIRPLGDNWGLSHAEALLGGLAQAEHRFADAVDHLDRAAEAAGNLGFGAAAAHHLTNLGRVQQEAGDLGAARTALHQAVAAAEAVGDARTAAYARAHLGWVLRALGEPADARLAVRSAHQWYEAAGGGEGAVLADYALAALDADQALTHAADHLDQVLATARRDGQGEVEVLTLDRLARLRAEAGDLGDAQALLSAADELAPVVYHLMSDSDRIDRDRAWSLIAASPLSPGS